MRRATVAVILAWTALGLACAAPEFEVQRQAILDACLARADASWENVTRLRPEMGARDLFWLALVYCETGQHLDRLQQIFATAARMQDRDEASRWFGNFHWRWREGAVLDANAVDFCMQYAAPLWLRHRDELPADARATLAEILDYAVQGSIGHRVPPSYTNIALMNAGNLVLLGEALDRPEVTQEGLARLDAVCLYTWEAGIHEYDSPTYYGVDLDDLMLLHDLTSNETARERAAALLDLFWQDIALNWYPPAQRLAGARSRDYDYLHGLGALDAQMWAAGWLEAEPTTSLAPALASWRPDEALLTMSATRFPRLVRQSWGPGALENRTHYLLADVTLSSAGAGYGSMDLPLTVDFPGPREQVRGYFIPDGRRDPYGQKRIPAGPHEKTLHLQPFWAAAQRTTDALGLVIYRAGDYDPNPATLESHFVLPREVDGAWIGGREIDLGRETFAEPLAPGEALVIRKGTAAVGLRVPWTRALDGGAAQVALVSDGNRHGAMRLTVAHHGFWGIEAADSRPGAAFWVRVGGGLDDASFARWRDDFAVAAAHVAASADHLRAEVAGMDGPVVLACAPPWTGCEEVEPAPARAVLELDGEEIGRPLLAELPVIREFEAQRARGIEVVAVPAEGVYLEAEDGVVRPQMRLDEDPDASGGRFVWMPGEVGGQASGEGSVTWQVEIREAGAYYLWARVLTPTQSDDSFFVRAYTEAAEPVGRADWHTGTHAQWEWAPVKFGRDDQPALLRLPAGTVSLEFSVREDGAKLDRVFLTPFPDLQPH